MYNEEWTPNDEHDYDPEETLKAVVKAKNELYHYGTPRHSGRYPYGSGENPYQHELDFIGHIGRLRKQGLSETAIAKSMGMSTTDYRAQLTNAQTKVREYNRQEAIRLKEKGVSVSAIGRRMGVRESTVRSWLDDDRAVRMNKAAKNANFLKERIEESLARGEPGYIDITNGVEHHLGLTKHTLANAVKALEAQGYVTHEVFVEQLGTGQQTRIKVICPPGTTRAQAMKNRYSIKLPFDVYSEDQELRKVEAPVSVDSRRVQIRYADDPDVSGKERDGLIELRRGVDDLSMGNAHYCQVRIAVDGTHYIKGMAVYADDLPDGIDIRFNTNKKSSVPMINRDDPDHSVLKPMKKGTDNPFGATIKDRDEDLKLAQRHYIGEDGKEHQSALNIVKEEGDVDDWGRRLASQFLSKQKPALAKRQLDLAYSIAKSEFDEIAAYTNPTVRAEMLMDFARKVDADAVHLAAAALPRQSNKLILPLVSTKDNEIYAPGYRDGEQVALVRYPHGGIFEIPVLTVNNGNQEGKRLMGTSPIDAVGINAKVAARLSGADFDGDTVLVLPVDGVSIKATGNNRPSAYKSLEDFDTGTYAKYPGMHIMTDQEKGREMGVATNLITDMTIKGATPAEICRATKYSMVVIDAQKHELDYKRAYDELRIGELKEKYQDGGGSSTFLSRSTSPLRVPERREKAFSKMSDEEKERYFNGEMIYKETGRTKGVPKPDPELLTKEDRKALKDAKGDKAATRLVERRLFAEGKMRWKENEVMEETEKGAYYDPYSLVSRNSEGKTTRIEAIYAGYATQMKDLARQARALARAQVPIEWNAEAREAYSEEIKSLRNKVALAERNAPLERQAQLIANAKFRAIRYEHPEMDDEHLRREKGRQLDIARRQVGAGKQVIGSKDNPLTDREWEAISKGAISQSLLKSVLRNADKARIKELAMPRTKTGISNAKVAQVKSMLANGYGTADICDILDISSSQLRRVVEDMNG